MSQKDNTKFTKVFTVLKRGEGVKAIAKTASKVKNGIAFHQKID